MSGVIFRTERGAFPWGTAVVNIIGCFLIGLIWAVIERVALPENMRAFLLIGFLGAFTTFSTYMIENVDLMRYGQFRLAVWNIFLSTGAGLCAAGGGFYLIRGLCGIE